MNLILEVAWIRKSAWCEFGGLTLNQAYSHFIQNPLAYQEDFMFMGSAAFLYYFPVIERYLYSVQVESEFDDCQAWILSMALIHQLDDSSLAHNGRFMDRIGRLARHVLTHLSQYATDIEEQTRIEAGWLKLKSILPSNLDPS